MKETGAEHHADLHRCLASLKLEERTQAQLHLAVGMFQLVFFLCLNDSRSMMLLVQRSETWRSGSQRGAVASSSNQCQEQLQAESQRLKAVGGPLQSARKSGSPMLQTGGQVKPRPHRRPSGRTRRPCLSSPRHSAARSIAQLSRQDATDLREASWAHRAECAQQRQARIEPVL